MTGRGGGERACRPLRRFSPARTTYSPAPPPHPIQKKSAQRVASKNGSNFGYFFPTSKSSTGGGEVFHTVSGQTRLDAVSVLATPPSTRPRGGGEEVWATGTTLLCIQRPHCSQPGRRPSRSLVSQWGDTLGLWWCRDTPSLRTRAVCRICRTTCRPSHRLRRPPPLCTFCPSCSRCSHHWERRRPSKRPHLLVLLLPLQQRMSQI